MNEPYKWVITLTNGSLVKMGDIHQTTKKEISSSDLDPALVSTIQLFPTLPRGKVVEVRINVEQREQFVRFWRTFMWADGKSCRINVIGIRTTSGVEYRLYVFPDGRVVMSSDELFINNQPTAQLVAEECAA